MPGKRDGAILTPDMIADNAAGGRDYAGAIVEVPEAHRRCRYVLDAFKARNGGLSSLGTGN